MLKHFMPLALEGELLEPRYTVFKHRYQTKWAQCLPFRAQSEFAECTECFKLKEAIKKEKVGRGL